MIHSQENAHLGTIIMLGSLWGLSEALLGMWLRTCASLMSGSVMTGVAFFFIAATWFLSPHVIAVFLLILIASLFKMFDALILSLPIQHGAIGNPIFAFFTQGVVFLFLSGRIMKNQQKRKSGQALLGGISALLASGFFPLVKFVTGVPACVYPGTATPLAVYFAPLAIAISVISVPAGFWAGSRISNASSGSPAVTVHEKMNYWISPAILAICLAIITIVRRL